MSNIPISSLPIAISVDGSEYTDIVQGGTTKRVQLSRINSSNPANVPPGGITGQALVKTGSSNYQTGWATVSGLGTVQVINTGAGLTGGPITVSGTISLANIANNTVLANVSGAGAAPTATSPSAILDIFGNTQGQVLYRSGSAWQALAPGTNGQVLTSAGPASNPSWTSLSGTGTVTSVALSLPSFITVSGSPVTTSGTLTGTLATQTANTVFAGPSSGGAVAPTFRALVGADLPNPAASTKGGVQSAAAVTNQWINSISTSGVPALSQPVFSNISGTVAATQLPNPTSTTLGGVRSYAAVTSQWINTISTSGIPSSTQPAFSDISGQTTPAQLPSIGNNTILSNISGGTSSPLANSLTSLLDTIGGTQGQLLYRNASNWTILAPGVNGDVLTSGGPAANPAWLTVSGTGTVTSITSGTGITLSPSTITTTGSVALASIASQRILANVTGGSAAPIANTMTSLLDLIGSTQGQVLYRGASNWTALSAGVSGQFLQTLGAGSTPQWATPAYTSRVVVQTFTSSGTYTPTSGMLYAVIECLAGGGGGGGSLAPAASTMAFGAGGGSGEYRRASISAASIGASKAVTIGAAGTAGTAAGADGGNGGVTSVGSLVVANGGGGGAANGGSSGSGGAGTGGSGGTGTFGLSGFAGAQRGSHTAIFPEGAGANAPLGFGQGGYASATPGTGISAQGRGAGGAGAIGFNLVAADGGAGTAGLVIITEYVNG